MENQKIMIFLDNTNNQLSKFRKKNWAEINDMYVEHTTQLVESNSRPKC